MDGIPYTIMGCPLLSKLPRPMVGLWTPVDPRNHVLDWLQIQLNRPCVAVMRPFVKLLWPPAIIRLHHSTTYIDMAYCYRPSSVVCLSICLSVCHSSEPYKNGWTDQDAIWDAESRGPTVPHITWGADAPMGRGIFRGVYGPLQGIEFWGLGKRVSCAKTDWS